MRTNYQTVKRPTCRVDEKSDFKSKFTLIRSLSSRSLGQSDLKEAAHSHGYGERGNAAFVCLKTSRHAEILSQFLFSHTHIHTHKGHGL